MAEKIKNHAFAARGRRADSPYKWEEWSDGEQYLLTQGEDYPTEAAIFRNAAYAHGRTKRYQDETHPFGIEIDVDIVSFKDSNQVVIQFTDRPALEPKKREALEVEIPEPKGSRVRA